MLTGLGGGGSCLQAHPARIPRLDAAAAHVVRRRDGEVRDYSPWGYDERQYNALGFDLPVGRLTRTPHGEYPEYHTSADDLDFVTDDELADAFAAVTEVIDVLEGDEVLLNASPFGEPQLGKRGLYPPTGGGSATADVMAMLWCLALRTRHRAARDRRPRRTPLRRGQDGRRPVALSRAAAAPRADATMSGRTTSGRASLAHLAKRVLLSVPLPQSPRRRASDAAEYWTAGSGDDQQWRADSHVRGGVPDWDLIGPEHLAYFLDFVRALQGDPRPARILEWGAGGGANAVAFAPLAQEFIAVDVSQAALVECRARVAETCSTTFTPVLVPVERPESARELVDGDVDLFLCFYVMELLPSKQHARRVIETAAALLRPGGLAVVQVKYRTRSPLTRSRTWAYRRGVASMTSFGLDEFWTLCAEHGLTPHSVRLVPRNRLDERYAYYFLVRT